MNTKINVKRKNYIQILKEIAEINGGKIISIKWEGQIKKYEFELNNGIKFTSHYQTILKRWPQKEDNRFKDNNFFLKEMSDIAISRGGKLLSTMWKTSKDIYDFIDGNGIKFSLSIGSLRNGSWTPNRGLVSEPICKQVMEHLFGFKFIKTRKVLTKEICKTNLPLELDGYCRELKIAFEYQGYPSHWDNNHISYEATSKRDLLKKEICKFLGIRLIVIPKMKVNSHSWDGNKIFQFIFQIVNKSYKDIQANMPNLNIINFKVDYSKINHSLDMINKLKEVAEKNKGRLISTEWKGAHSKYLFQFASGNEFQTSATSIISKGWPKNEIEYLKTNIDRLNELKDIAEKNGGKLISKIWKGVNYLYEFNLSSGEKFKIRIDNIKKGWPKDEQKYLKAYLAQKIPKQNYLNELKEMAEKNNGKLLSTEWTNNKFKYKFEAENGFIFEMKAEKMRERGWPKNFEIYSRTDEQHFNELKEIAEKSNIKLLEDKWLGIFAKYLCEFQDGRQFSLSADMIKRRGFPKNDDRYFKTLKSRKK